MKALQVTRKRYENYGSIETIYFRPEFLNRFNAVIEFSHLGKEDSG